MSQTEVDGSLTIIDNFDKTEKMRKEKNSHRRDAGNFDSKVSSLMSGMIATTTAETYTLCVEPDPERHIVIYSAILALRN